MWCPSSNLFTLSQPVRPQVLRSGVPVCLGTDSALTCQDDLASEIKIASKAGCLAPEDVYPMVTTGAASILCLTRGEGEVKENAIADLLAVPDSGQNPAEALQNFAQQNFSPSLVIRGGKIQLVSKSLAPRIDPVLIRSFQKIELEGRGSWLVNANISHLHAAAVEAVLGPRFQLAGRTVRI